MEQLSVLTNIPNPYNGFLYDHLRKIGWPLEVIYRGLPSFDGRPWDLHPEPPDRVANTLWDERQVFRRRKGVDQTIVLAGSWATPRDSLRRLSAAVSHRRGSRVLVWGEAMSGRGGARGLARRLHFSLPGLDAVLAIGSHSVPSFRKATGGRVPIHVLPYTTSSGLDIDPVRSTTPSVGVVGRFIPYKGIDVAMRAVAAIAPADRPRLEIVGSGPLERQLRELAADLSVDPVFHGEVDAQRLAEIRAGWWACLVPSQEVDGWALVVPEALNSSVPVITSAFVGASHDMIRGGLEGQVVSRASAADPQVWAEAITRLIGEDQEVVARQARRVGAAFAPSFAARWLDELLRGDLDTERSFVDDAWTRLSTET